MALTEIQRTVLEAALRTGDACNARSIDNRRVRSRTISELQSRKLLYSRNIDGAVEITPAGEALVSA